MFNIIYFYEQFFKFSTQSNPSYDNHLNYYYSNNQFRAPISALKHNASSDQQQPVNNDRKFGILYVGVAKRFDCAYIFNILK